MKKYIAIPLVVVLCLVMATWNLKGTHAQNTGTPIATAGVPAPMMSGIGDPVTLGVPCDLSHADLPFYNRVSGTTRPIWLCDRATLNWIQSAQIIATPFQNQDFSLQPSLFATAAVKSNVYFEPYALSILAVTTRIEGSPICTAAPTVVILDLGTSPSTAYASATILYSQATATSNTVVSGSSLSIAVAAGHYLGIGLSAGACVTPPTISTVVTLQ